MAYKNTQELIDDLIQYNAEIQVTSENPLVVNWRENFLFCGTKMINSPECFGLLKTDKKGVAE